MAENLPVELDMTASRNIAERARLAFKGEMGTIGYGYPDADRGVLIREFAMAMARLCDIALGGAPRSFHCGGCRCAGEDEKRATGQEDAPESEWASLAKGTLP